MQNKKYWENLGQERKELKAKLKPLNKLYLLAIDNEDTEEAARLRAITRPLNDRLIYLGIMWYSF